MEIQYLWLIKSVCIRLDLATLLGWLLLPGPGEPAPPHPPYFRYGFASLSQDQKSCQIFRTVKRN